MGAAQQKKLKALYEHVSAELSTQITTLDTLTAHAAEARAQWKQDLAHLRTALAMAA